MRNDICVVRHDGHIATSPGIGQMIYPNSIGWPLFAAPLFASDFIDAEALAVGFSAASEVYSYPTASHA